MKSTVLMIEPFYGGSHQQLIDTLVQNLSEEKSDDVYLVTLPAKKWHWRARTGALYLSQTIERNPNFKVLFTSSVLNLAELIALRPDLSTLKKIVYFHENQLVYPIKKEKSRDFQYGYNQITTCLVADIIVFNSNFNRSSFLNAINTFLKLQPDFRPQNIRECIEVKCKVLYFPIKFPVIEIGLGLVIENNSSLHIVWPHRWEHDKDPETFFLVLTTLAAMGKSFIVSVLGEMFSDIPPIFEEAKRTLSKHIQHFGFIESKGEYYRILKQAHVVVSTAKHEFYGVAMLEAVFCGCFPLCPNALVYPEIYPKACLYNTINQLVKRLSQFCDRPATAKIALQRLDFDFTKHSAHNLLPKYRPLFHST